MGVPEPSDYTMNCPRCGKPVPANHLSDRGNLTFECRDCKVPWTLRSNSPFFPKELKEVYAAYREQRRGERRVEKARAIIKAAEATAEVGGDG